MGHFDAFMSYSHAADGRLAPAVQRGLVRLARSPLQRRALTVFRDETGLSTNPHLWASIEDALDDSDWFVLLASPESASSPWVEREVARWLASKPLDRLLIVLTDGELAFVPGRGVDTVVTTSLPKPLADVLVDEPRWLDLRWARDDTQLDLRNGRFRAAIADLAAPIHGVAKDDLESEDVRQQRRLRRLMVGGVAAIGLLAVVSLVGAFVAVDRGREARAQRNVAEAQRIAADEAAVHATAIALGARAEALRTTDAGLSLLLAAEGFRTEAGNSTKSSLLSALDENRLLVDLEPTVPDDVGDIEVSPDRTALYLVTYSGDLWEYSTATMEPVGGPIVSGLQDPWSLDLSRDGRRLAVADGLGITVLDTSARQIVRDRIGRSVGVPGLSPDGSFVAVGFQSEPVVRVYSVDTGDMIGEIESPESAPTFIDNQRLAIHPLGSTLFDVYAIGSDGLRLDRELDLGIPGGGTEVSPDGSVIITGGLTGEAVLLEADTLEQRGPVLRVRGSRTGDFFFSADGSLVGLSSDDGTVIAVSSADGRHVAELTGLTGALVTEFIGDSRLLSASLSGSSHAIWELGPRGPIGDTVLMPDVSTLSTIDNGANAVIAAGRSLSVAPTDNLDQPIISRELGDIVRSVAVAEGAGRAVAYVLEIDETQEVVSDRHLDVIELADLSTIATLSVGDQPVERATISPDGSMVAVGYRSGQLAVYESGTFAPLLDASDVDTFPCCLGLVVWSPDGTRLFTGGQDGTLRSFDTTTWELIREKVLVPGQFALRLGEFTDDGSTLLVPSESGEVYLVDPNTLESTHPPFVAAGTQLQRARLSADGTLLASQSRDGAVRLWDVDSGLALGPALHGHDDFSLTLEPAEEDRLISSGVDGSVIFWDLDPTSWFSRACDLAGRNLSKAEWEKFVGGEYRRTCEQWPEGE